MVDHDLGTTFACLWTLLLFMNDFFFDILVIPTLALCILSAGMAPMGCFLVWRRLSFFGDGLSHACTLGVGLGMWMHAPITVGILGIAILCALFLYLFQKWDFLTLETLFAVLSYTFFASGIILLGTLKDSHVNIDDVLFGDVLSIQYTDVVGISIISLGILFFLTSYWKVLVILCLHKDLATSMFGHHKWVELLFFICAAGVIAFGMQLIGAVLLPALIIIPCAAARAISKTPPQMMKIAIFVAISSCLLGMGASYFFDTLPSPTIVLTASLIFCGTTLWNKILLKL